LLKKHIHFNDRKMQNTGFFSGIDNNDRGNRSSSVELSTLHHRFFQTHMKYIEKSQDKDISLIFLHGWRGKKRLYLHCIPKIDLFLPGY